MTLFNVVFLDLLYVYVNDMRTFFISIPTCIFKTHRLLHVLTPLKVLPPEI